MLVAANAQRSPYAGSRPGSGYKDRFVPNNNAQTTDGLDNGVGDRIDLSASTGNAVPSTTARLPYDALGDAVIVNHWNSLPIDQRPFWIVNQQHIEAHRGTPSRPAQGSVPQTTASRPINTDNDVISRFGTSQSNPQQNFNSGINTISQPEVVYPSNITPEQKLQMQIIFAQNHLAALQEQQRQQLAQQGQLTTQQTNFGNNQSTRNQNRNFVRSRRSF